MSEENREKKNNKAFLLLCVVAVIGTSWFLLQNLIILTQYEKTEGTVLSVETLRTTAGDNSRSYMPTVRYKCNDGSSVTSTTKLGKSVYNFSKGDKLPIYYDPKNKNNFEIATFMCMWAATLAGAILTILICLFYKKVVLSVDENTKETNEGSSAES